MSAPRHLLNVLDLLRELVQHTGRRGSGPVRLEAPLAILEDEKSIARSGLRDAAFVDAAVRTNGEFARAQSLALSMDFFLDLRLNFLPDASSFPEPHRIARLRILVPELSALVDAESTERVITAANRMRGIVILDFPLLHSADLTTLHAWLRNLAPLSSRLLLTARPSTAVIPLASKLFPELRACAEASLLALDIGGVGHVPAAKPADPLAAFNVLAEAYRALFRPRAALCPMPFLMLRFESTGAARACPHPDGPILTGDDPFHSAAADHLREAHLRGTPPTVCQSCALFPKFRRTLEPESLPSDSSSLDSSFTV